MNNDLISKAELFNKLAVIKAPPEANEYKGEVYSVIQAMKTDGSINRIALEIHENAIKHGWWDTERTFGEIIALCHSELSEALEAYRNREPMVWINDAKPEGIAIELVDCVIRIFDYLIRQNIDIQKCIEIKHAYNETRPYRHGGKRM